MRFKDRFEAGRLLAKKLKQYVGGKVVVYAIPRGGVVTASEIAKALRAPLDLIIARKISHPDNPEYAIAAITQNSYLAGTRKELKLIDKNWFKERIRKERQEIARRRKEYSQDIKMISAEGKIAILVDDGVATGLTLRVGIIEIKYHNPAKLVVAVPVVPESTAKIIKQEADELVVLDIPSDDKFLGAVGSYYDNFTQVTDREVIKILDEYRKLQFDTKMT